MFAGSRRLRRIRRNDWCRRISAFFDAFRRLLLQIGGANIADADRAVEPGYFVVARRQKARLLTPPQHAGSAIRFDCSARLRSLRLIARFARCDVRREPPSSSDQTKRLV